MARAARPKPRGTGVARRLFLLLAGLAVVFGTGCLSPTLPLPPPNRPDTVEGPDAQGMVRISGTVHSNSLVYAFNAQNSQGVFQRVGGNGRYNLTIAAQIGDEITLWYESEGETSPAIIFAIPDPALR
jgi:hypothetical protein